MTCRRERSRAVTAVFGGLDVGSAVGLILCGPLIKHAGWPSVFYLFAAMGLLWTLLFPRLNPDDADELVPSELQPDAPGCLPLDLCSSPAFEFTCGPVRCLALLDLLRQRHATALLRFCLRFSTRHLHRDCNRFQSRYAFQATDAWPCGRVRSNYLSFTLHML